MTVATASATTFDTFVGLRACVFTVGAEPFAFVVRRVREVVLLDRLTKVPAAPPQVVGVANLRGDVLPIVDPERLLGAAIRRAGDVLGLETFDDVLEIGDASRKPYVACALGRLRRSDGLVTLLDADAVVAALRHRVI